MKPIALAALLLTQVPAPTETKLGLWINGAQVGTGIQSERFLPEGNKSTVLTLEIRPEQNGSRVRQETTVDAKGRATRKIMEIVSGRSNRKLIIAELSGTGANVTITENGKTSKQVIPVSDQVPTENPSEFWFRTTKPKVGEKAVYYGFDMSELRWRLEEVVYEGQKTLEFNSRKLSGHQLKVRDGIALVDDKGRPLLIRTPGVEMAMEPAP